MSKLIGSAGGDAGRNRRRPENGIYIPYFKYQLTFPKLFCLAVMLARLTLVFKFIEAWKMGKTMKNVEHAIRLPHLRAAAVGSPLLPDLSHRF
jgi:hypothetical protein